jgi:hypothetical protein
MGEFVVLVFFAVCCAIAAMMVAQRRGRSAGLWFLAGLLLGPFGVRASGSVRRQECIHRSLCVMQELA